MMPRTMAVIESPGIPSVKAGTHAPASAELLAAPASATPSSEPRPYSSGVGDARLDSPYVTQAAMSAPAPGRMPIAVPIALACSVCHGRRHSSDKEPENTDASDAFARGAETRGAPPSARTPRSTSDRPNRPTSAGMKLTPWNSSGRPNVKRASVCTGERPTVENSSPSSSANAPFKGDSRDTATAQPSPST